MNSILLQVLLYIVGAIAGIWFGLHSAKDVFTLNSSSSTTMLGEGKERTKEKAKIFEKEKVRDPAAPIPNAGNNGGNMAYNQPQLPDMRGIDYGSSGNIPPVNGMGGGIGVTAAVGAVNVIGIGQQDGEIHNVTAGAQVKVKGPVRQQGMIYNQKPKGVKTIEQQGSSIFNTISKGRLAVSATGNEFKTSIAEGRTDVKPLGNSKIYTGDVKSIKAGQGDIYTPSLKINGVSKAGSLYAQNFIAPKSMREKAQALRSAQMTPRIKQASLNAGGAEEIVEQQNIKIINNGENELKLGLDSGRGGKEKRVVITLNPVNLLNGGNRRYVSTTEHFQKTLSLEQVFSDSQNGKLSKEQLVTLAAVYREVSKMAISGDTNYQNIVKQFAQSGGDSYQNMYQVIQARPDVKEPREIILAASMIPQLIKEKERSRRLNASLMTNRRNIQKDLQAENINYLNSIVRNDGGIANQFNTAVDEAYRKDVEKRARENLEKRSNMSLEEKEKEYEEQVKKLMESESEEDKKRAEKSIKERILKDPEEAKRILGEKGARELKEHMSDQEEKAYQKNLEKQEKVADSEFKKVHSEYQGSGDNEVREARRKAEMQEAIDKAITATREQFKKDSEARQSEEEKKGDRERSSFEEYKKRRLAQEEEYRTNLEGSIPQPNGSSAIYIPRSVQEQMARKGSGSV